MRERSFLGATDSVDSALESPKSQLSNARKIKSITHLVDDISQNQNWPTSDFSTFLRVFNFLFYIMIVLFSLFSLITPIQRETFNIGCFIFPHFGKIV